MYKNAFFKSVPKEIIRLANEKNVPIFLFEDTYIDDIIFAVRNALQEDVIRDVAAEKLEELLWSEEPSREESVKVMKRVSPFLYEHYLCMYTCLLYTSPKIHGAICEHIDQLVLPVLFTILAFCLGNGNQFCLFPGIFLRR